MSAWYERLRSQTAAFAHDLVMIPAAWLGAYWLRFNLGSVPDDYVEGAFAALPVVLVCQGLINWMFGLYRGVWRFASLPDLERIVKAVLTGTAVGLFVLFILNRMDGIPRSVPLLYPILLSLLLAGPRLFYRWLKDYRHLVLREGQRVLIVGAGRAGEMLARDMLRDRGCEYVPVAFVDDKLRRQGGEVQGVPIRGCPDDLVALSERLRVDLILLAIPSAPAAEMRRLIELCERSGRPFRIVPPLDKLMAGQISVDQLRPVCIEDLLGRTPVQLDWSGIHAGLAGRTILVTGGGGSIGSELCRQIAVSAPARLVVVDNCEFNLYRIDMELAERHPQLARTTRLLDVTDATAIERLFENERPQVVFHAAAYKHVPMLEYQARSAVRNNIIGTATVARAAGRHGSERFVLISTDKAVNPSNIMGATKRMAEVLCQTLDRDVETRYTAVRFGNVLDSAGSVVPLFRRQIECGGPVTVTHPEIERFFMTIPEACQLIMQASVIGRGGDIFVLDMGEPIKIGYLAEQMIRLSGKRPGADIAIEYIGLRPGEKLSEELHYASEDLAATDHVKIRRVRRRDPVAREHLERGLDELQAAVERGDEDALIIVLARLLPEWRPQRSARALAAAGH